MRKKAKELTMNESMAQQQALKNAEPIISGGQEFERGDNGAAMAPVQDEAFHDAVLAYNEKFTELDPLYSELEMFEDYLVRVKLVPLGKEGDVIIPNVMPVEVPTASNIGVLEYVENPYPYSLVGVIVAAPEGAKYKQGDQILFRENYIKSKAVGKGGDAVVLVNNSFVHPDFQKSYMFPPTDPSDRHYGYIFVGAYDVRLKLK